MSLLNNSTGTTMPWSPVYVNPLPVFSAQVNTAGINVISQKSYHTNKEASINWIIDTGATDHISCDLTLFIALKSMVKSFISLLNRQRVGVGTIHLHQSLVLYNILFVLEFSFNMISISKLIASGQICAIFIANQCLIQDPSS